LKKSGFTDALSWFSVVPPSLACPYCPCWFSVKRKRDIFSQKKTEKRKPVPQGRWEGMSGFLLKILPDARRVEIFNKTRRA
jgi:hypothetical protein